MQQHPVPQHISSYEFRLVGDMTLGQFFRIAGGALISLLFYALPIPGLIKWPFIILFAFLGIALAFLPLEERPLERWIFAFFKAVYSPTMFFWKKDENLRYFADEETATPSLKDIATPKGKDLAEEYLQAIPPTDSQGQVLSMFEKNESKFFEKISGIITPVAPQTTAIKPSTGVPGTGEINIPQTFRPQIVVEKKEEAKPAQSEKPIQTSSVGPTVGISINEKVAQQAQFSIDAAPPNPPTTPNTIVGQVMDANTHVVEGAILEVKDASGRPIRALRTNKVGHFLVVTPLINGRYELVVEKQGLEFDPLTFEAAGRIIPPIAIKARLQEFTPAPVITQPQPNVQNSTNQI